MTPMNSYRTTRLMLGVVFVSLSVAACSASEPSATIEGTGNGTQSTTSLPDPCSLVSIQAVAALADFDAPPVSATRRSDAHNICDYKTAKGMAVATIWVRGSAGMLGKQFPIAGGVNGDEAFLMHPVAVFARNGGRAVWAQSMFGAKGSKVSPEIAEVAVGNEAEEATYYEVAYQLAKLASANWH